MTKYLVFRLWITGQAYSWVLLDSLYRGYQHRMSFACFARYISNVFKNQGVSFCRRNKFRTELAGNSLVKSLPFCHCERSEAISWSLSNWNQGIASSLRSSQWHGKWLFTNSSKMTFSGQWNKSGNDPPCTPKNATWCCKHATFFLHIRDVAHV